MKLNILISTIGERILNVSDNILPPRKDIEYIIVHQAENMLDEDLPKSLIRDDIVIKKITGVGVTKSRNEALKISTGDILIFSDDDAAYTSEAIEKVKFVFKENKKLDAALFKIKTLEGDSEYKEYPLDKIERMSAVPFSISTLEIVVRAESVKQKSIFFDERFGAGRKYLIGGEETLFIEDCLDSGLNVAYFPYYLASHPWQSTSRKIKKLDMRKVCVIGAVDARKNGWIAIPKAAGAAIKYRKNLAFNKVSLFSYVVYRMFSAAYILMTNRR